MPAGAPDGLAFALSLSLAAGVCSGLGGVIAVVFAGPDMPLHRLAVSQAAVGAALLFLGCCDILPEAAAGISITRTAVFFVLGAFGSGLTARAMRAHAAVQFGVPSVSSSATPNASASANRAPPGSADVVAAHSGATHVLSLRHEVLVVGLVTFVSLSVHNLLEGMSILLAVNDGVENGIRLAAAVSLENIPEGLSIALPVYFATRRKSTAIRLALCSGMLEPIGVLLPGFFLRDPMSQNVISSLLAIIAGILVFVAFAEMLPLAVKTAGTRRMTSLSMWMGAGVLCATIFQPLLMYHGRVGLIA